VNASDLKQARQSLGLTQLRLAEALGVRRQTVANWEMGRTPVPALVELAIRGLYVAKVEEYKDTLELLQEVREFQKFQESRRKLTVSALAP